MMKQVYYLIRRDAMKKIIKNLVGFIITLLIFLPVHANPLASLGPFTIIPSAGPNGTISPNTAQTVNYNSSRQFIATPAPGYKVASWLVDGVVVQTSGIHYLFSNVTANHTVQVTFRNDLSIIYAGAENGKVYYSVDDGLNWNATPISPTSNGNPVKSVFASPTLLYAGMANGSIYYSWTNGGLWAAMTKPDGGAVNGLFATSTLLYAATSKGNVYTSSNNGTSWTKLTSPKAGYAVNSIFVNGPMMLYAGSADGNAYFSNNGGQTWKPMNGSPDTTAVKNIFIGGNQIYVNTQTQFVYSSTNLAGCGSWTPYAQSAYTFFVSPSASKIYAGTECGYVFSLKDGTGRGFVDYTPLNSIFILE